MKFGILSIVLALAFAGCSASQPILSVGNLQGNPGKPVSARVSSVSILGVNPLSLESAKQLLDSLRIQCGGSKLTGLWAEDRSTYLFLATLESVQAFGYCAQ
jgi:hypothetical protein